MKINQNSNQSRQTSSIVNELEDQINALQQDTAALATNLNSLENTVENDSVSKSDTNPQNIPRLMSPNATLTHVSSQRIDAAAAEVTDLSVPNTATIGTETVGNSTITDLSAQRVQVTESLASPNLTVNNDITAGGKIESSTKVKAPRVETNYVDTNDVQTGTLHSSTANIDVITADNVTANNKITTKDLEVTGAITGISTVSLDSLTATTVSADNSDFDKIVYKDRFMDNTRRLHPTPDLSDTDRYTIELPSFTGTCYLVWKDEFVKWNAVVIGNGVNYDITWGCPNTEDVLVTNLFQYNGKLYIRTCANGDLLYAYDTTEELASPTIYFNMTGWTNPKSLEELCTQEYKFNCLRSSGWFGFGVHTYPLLENPNDDELKFRFKGSTTIANIPNFSTVLPGDVWNITDYGYTDNRFVEGAGKPINIGDDIIAVKVDVEGTLLIKEEEVPFNTLDPDKLFVTSNGSKIVTFTNGDVYKEVDSRWQLIPTLSDLDYTYNYLFELANGTLLASSRNTYYGYLMYSTDEGDTWQPTDLDFGDNGMTESIIQTSTGRVIISTHEGVFYSDNNGLNWSSLANAPWYGVFVKLADETILAVGCEDSKVYNSSDDGETWTEISSGIDINAICETIADKVVVIEPYSITPRALISSDYGYTWLVISGLNANEIRGLVKVDDTLYAYGKYIWRTPNGINWLREEKPEDIQWYQDLDYIEDEPYFIGTTENNVPGLYYFGGSSKVLKWDKFSAGVNYDNFVAKNITATESLKTEGTLSVDGNSTLHNINQTGNTTQNGNYTATGNLNRIGNETIIGTVVIGDLD